MATSLKDNLPEVLKSVRTRPLFVIHLNVAPLVVVGAIPGGARRIGPISGGVFEGERLSGEVMDKGSDWQSVRSDGVTALDARIVLKTRDNALICMTYRGLRHGPPDVLARIDKGDRSIRRLTISASTHYSRPAAKYDWINRVLAGGIGQRRNDGPLYSVFEVL